MGDMVAVETTFNVSGTEDGSVHRNAERVMAQLVELSDAGVILDGSTGADSTTGMVTISVTVRAADLVEGVSQAFTAMRNAIHAAGNATPDWPTHRDWMEMVAQSVTAELVPA